MSVVCCYCFFVDFINGIHFDTFQWYTATSAHVAGADRLPRPQCTPVINGAYLKLGLSFSHRKVLDHLPMTPLKTVNYTQSWPKHLLLIKMNHLKHFGASNWPEGNLGTGCLYRLSLIRCMINSNNWFENTKWKTMILRTPGCVFCKECINTRKIPGRKIANR